MSRRCEVTGKSVQTGNNVSHANNKTRRRFLPNLQKVSFLSETLGHTIQLRVSANGIRTVEANGGIDSFLLKANSDNLSSKAKSLKKLVKNKQNKE